MMNNFASAGTPRRLFLVGALQLLVGSFTLVAVAAGVVADASVAGVPWTPGHGIEHVRDLVEVGRCCNGSGALFVVKTDGRDAYAEHPIQVGVFRGSHYDMGFAVGRLLGKQAYDNYEALFTSYLPEGWERGAMRIFLDWQWDEYLSQQFPQAYRDELRGVGDGGEVWKLPMRLESLIAQTFVLSNLPGDVESNIEWLIFNEALGESFGEMLDPARRRLVSKLTAYAGGEKRGLRDVLGALRRVDWEGLRMKCSWFAAWGNRTKDGQLYSMRNLDWAPNTGINRNKIVSVYHPTGETAHATIGFSGLIGALVGVSEAGLTAHEAGLNVKQETFEGFTWTMRLREVLAKAKNLAQARSIWDATNNTCGINHLIASAPDVLAGRPGAMAMETMARVTAFYQQDDPRERALEWTDPKTGVKHHLGRPLKEAVWRTNNAYDPRLVKEQTEEFTPTSDSIVRYFILSDTFSWYESEGIKIEPTQAVNLTAILGDKGSSKRDGFYKCPDKAKGINVLSVTFEPSPAQGRMWAAWGIGEKESWRPACCGTYVEFDLATLWKLA